MRSRTFKNYNNRENCWKKKNEKNLIQKNISLNHVFMIFTVVFILYFRNTPFISPSW